MIKGPRGTTGPTGATGATGPSLILPEWSATNDRTSSIVLLTGQDTRAVSLYNAEFIDNFASYDPTTSIYTIPISGNYTFYAQARVDITTASETPVIAIAVLAIEDVATSFSLSGSQFRELISSSDGDVTSVTLVTSAKRPLTAGTRIRAVVSNGSIGSVTMTLVGSPPFYSFYGSKNQ